GHLAGAAARDRGRHRGRAAPVGPGRDTERRDRRDGDDPTSRPRRGRVYQVRLGLPGVHGSPAGQEGDRAGTQLPTFVTFTNVKTIPAALHIPELADEPGLIHGFSTVLLGSVGLTHAPEREPVLASRRSFLEVLGLEHRTLTTAGAIHGAAVARVDGPVDLIDDVDA